MNKIKHRIELLSLLPENPVVAELGVAEGLFSRDLLEAGVSVLYSVDAWRHIPNIKGDGNFEQEWHDNNYENAKKLLEPFGERSIILRGLSTEMNIHVKDNSLDLLYMDCNHLYEGVTAELNAWFSKVKVGGIIATHDYAMPQYGVKQAFEDFCRGKFEIIEIPENEPKDAGAFIIKKQTIW
jgi:hypothetical protein